MKKLLSVMLALLIAMSVMAVPALADELKPRLLSALKTTFGIESMKRIKVVIEKLDGSAPEPLEAVTPAERTPPAPTADVSAGDASAAAGK